MNSTPENGLAILGGTFDPVHLGHLFLAQDAIEALRLERVLFVPAARNPLKANRPEATDVQRLEMLQLALRSDRRFLLDDLEIRAGGSSYSIDTVRILRRRYPDIKLYWVIGSDELQQLWKWRRIDELLKLVDFISLSRPGYSRIAPCLAGLKVHEIYGHAIDVSASDIRNRVKEGLQVSLFLPPKVWHYIRYHGLYR